MKVDEYITGLRKKNNIIITVDNNELKIRASQGALTKDILEEIRAKKTQIIDFFRDVSSQENAVLIPEVAGKTLYKLSSPQRRLYFLYKIDKESLAYNMPFIVTLDGALDRERLHNTFRNLISRHESLRTSFHYIKDEVYQRISEDVDFSIETFRARPEEVAAISKKFVRPFDLENDCLMRVGLIEISAVQHVLMLDMHHIIADGVSQSTMIREFGLLYTGNKLSPLRLQYKDYAEWQQSIQKSNSRQKQFWNHEFAEELASLDLPTDFRRPPAKSYEGGAISFVLPAEETQGLKALAEKERATVFMVILSLYNILLSRLCNQEDIVVGVPVAGRQNADLENIIGMFVNVLPLRSFPRGELRYREYLSMLRSKTLECLDNQSYELEELILDLKIQRDLSRNPLFDVIFEFKESEASTSMISGLTITPCPNALAVSKFDLALWAIVSGEKIDFKMEYSTDLFQRATIERFVAYFKRIISAVTNDPAIRISEIALIDQNEKQHLVERFNNTATDRDRTLTVISQFRAQARKTPDSAAVRYKEKVFTYQQIDEHSDRIAAHLMGKMGIRPGALVGLLLQRDEYLLQFVLGILKTGAAFVPIDPEYPLDRVMSIIQNAKLDLLITRREYHKAAMAEVPAWMDWSDDVRFPGSLPPGQSHVDLSSNHLAYVIFTSGSTGKPKGVMVEHGALANYIVWAGGYYLDNHVSVFPLYTSISFDLTITSIFTPLVTGGQIIVYPEAEHGTAIESVMNENAVDIIKLTPSHLKILREKKMLNPAAFDKLRKIIVGGEDLETRLAGDVYEQYQGKIDIYNEYGPTEATVGCMIYRFDPHDASLSVPIGVPVSNTQIYLLDRFRNPVPIGVAGEIYISGDSLAKGYLLNEDLTREKFVTNPFIRGARMYKTGDLATRLSDGRILFRGRTDDQVKIRGFRIELAEIEGALTAYGRIKKAVVLVRARESQKHLVAYYVSEGEIGTPELKSFLAQRLPDYMVPSFYVQLQDIPLTPNGKVLKKALPDPVLAPGTDHSLPANEIETTLAGIWSEVLKTERSTVSMTGTFFELGGNSLEALTIIMRMQKVFDVNVSINEFFNRSSIRELARYIEAQIHANKPTREYTAIPVVADAAYYRSSSAQKRLYFLQEFSRNSTAYNLPSAIRLNGPLDVLKLRAAFNGMFSRQQGLRTYFEVIDDEPVQKVADKIDFDIERYTLADGSERTIMENFIRPFDLGTAPLLRAGLIEIKPDEHILLVDMHHIITDGVSQNILIKELTALYSGKPVPAPKIQYKDYAHWQYTAKQQESMTKHEQFWLSEFQGETTLDLPADHARPLVRNYEGDFLQFEVSEEETRALQEIATSQGATSFMVLLSLYNIFLSKLCSREDVALGTSTAGRLHPDLESVIGVFVNIIVLRNYPRGELRYDEFLADVKSRALACFEHQDYPYEVLIDRLKVTRDTGRNPLFDAMFMFQNYETTALKMEGLTATALSLEHPVSKFDLTLIAEETDNKIRFTFEYASQLFRRETIERFAGFFKQIVRAVIADPAVKVSAISMLTEAEKRKLIHQFNETDTDYAREATIVSLFAEQVKMRPDNIAVVSGDERVSYAELDRRSDAIACQLIDAHGIKAGDFVGLMLDRDSHLLPSLLGVLKAGAAYVPIDPSYPAQRIEYILENSGVRLVLTSQSLREAMHLHGNSKFADLDTGAGQRKASANKPRVDSSALAYMIYTSGSTGNPKGVMIAHSNVINFVKGITARIDMAGSSTVLCLTTMSFDIFALETILPLLTGMKVILASSEEQKDPALLTTLIRKHNVDLVQITPSHLKLMLTNGNTGDMLNSIKILMVGGEAFGQDLLKELRKQYRGSLYNMYGPTETTVWSTMQDLTHAETITIGKPIANTRIRILDQHNNLVPVGVSGELCIGGAGVARGYWMRQDLTEAKFVSDPFIENARMYRTGDLARWLPSGEIDFIGRKDHQVKIRGHRIELGEIESCLNAHDNINESAVVVSQRGDDKVLVAYYVVNQQADVSALRNYLSDKLPDYMMPSFFVPLSAMPLTANGKLNRKALPDPEFTNIAEGGRPSGEIELRLVKMWSEILKIDEQSIHVESSFFELGGHSMKVWSLINRMHAEFSVKVKLRDVYQNNTCRQLATLIKGLRRYLSERIPACEERAYYPCSPAQERIYWANMLHREDLSYNISIVMKVNGDMDIERLTRSFQSLIGRHEGLRTGFVLTEGGVMQRINKDARFVPEILDLKKHATVQEAFSSFVRPFDLSDDGLMRCGFLCSPEANLIFVDIHHIIADRTSLGILMTEFGKIYDNIPLAAPELKYTDYTLWLNRTAGKLSRQKEFWRKKLAGDLPVLDLPVERRVSDVPGIACATVLEVDGVYYSQMKRSAAAAGVSDFMYLISIYYILLSRISGNDEIIIGTDVVGRTHPALKDVVGTFVNILPLRLKIEAGITFGQLLHEVKTCVLDAFENQDFQFDQMVALVNDGKEQKHPVVSVHFSIVNAPDPMPARFEPISLARHKDAISDYDFKLEVMDRSDRMSISFIYNGLLFETTTIDLIKRYYFNILLSAIGNGDVQIDSIDMDDNTEVHYSDLEEKNNYK